MLCACCQSKRNWAEDNKDYSRTIGNKSQSDTIIFQVYRAQCFHIALNCRQLVASACSGFINLRPVPSRPGRVMPLTSRRCQFPGELNPTCIWVFLYFIYLVFPRYKFCAIETKAWKQCPAFAKAAISGALSPGPIDFTLFSLTFGCQSGDDDIVRLGVGPARPGPARLGQAMKCDCAVWQLL